MDFAGIEHALASSGTRLEISALMPGEDVPQDHRWLAELVVADGHRLAASAPKHHAVEALIGLEHRVSGKRRSAFRIQHHDTLALDLLRNVHAVITITQHRRHFRIVVRDHLDRFKEVHVEAASVWLALVEGVTAALAAVAAAHQSKFVGH